MSYYVRNIGDIKDPDLCILENSADIVIRTLDSFGYETRGKVLTEDLKFRIEINNGSYIPSTFLPIINERIPWNGIIFEFIDDCGKDIRDVESDPEKEGMNIGR